MTASKKAVLVIGGTSDIGRAIALRYASAGWNAVLWVRDLEGGQRDAADISARTGSEVQVHRMDVLETERMSEAMDLLSPLPDTAVCVVGELGDQVRAETDLAHATKIMRTNFEGPALLMGLLAERFLERGSGALVGVSSVAGDRGRGSNYLYGAAKAGFTAFLSGLRNRLHARNCTVLTVKPGFVRTKMTADMRLPPLITASAQEVAEAVYRAAEERKRDVIYVRPVWRPLMTVIRAIPEPVFKRLRL